ncbi:FBP domain-containing protein [Kitasatospora albolonga]|uniref:FBP domain-containing protein n=1 Tax=Kitasatospora albolonga TaxID=68173 RepID=UPI0031EA8EF2
MKALTDPEIRASFVNCTKGEASRIALPRHLDELPWEDMDFMGWRDPGAPTRSYIVAEHDGRLVGVALRFAQRTVGAHHGSMCSICLTTHVASGVSLMTARKARRASDDEYVSAGEYFCSDLACSLYVREKKRADASGIRMKENLTTEEKITRTRVNLSKFLTRVVTA